MHTVAFAPRPVQIPGEFERQWEQHRCYVCDRTIKVPADSPESPICPTCALMLAEREAQTLAGSIKELIAGSGPFACVDSNQRREMLIKCGVFRQPARNQADATNDRIRQLAVAAVAEWDALHPEAVAGIEALAAGEPLAVRTEADAPDTETRREIEDADEQEAREKAMAPDPFDTPFFS